MFRSWACIEKSGGGLAQLLLAVLAFLMLAGLPTTAAEKAQLLATEGEGYGRLVLSLPDRNELPPYKIRSENGILAVEFEEPIDLLLPDVAAALPQYISIARVDPDGRGVRFGLRTVFNFNRMEAGEKLFIDLLPPSWQGLPPALPPEIVAELARRAAEAEKLAEQKRRAEEAKRIQPTAALRIGRTPTLLRLQFNWSADTKATYAQEEQSAHLTFDWPVPVDLLDLTTDLPPEIESVANTVVPEGSRIGFALAKGVVPRFYKTDDTEFIVDIDLTPQDEAQAQIAHEVKEQDSGEALAFELAHAGDSNKAQPVAAHQVSQAFAGEPAAQLRPVVNEVGTTIRFVFPFHQETPSAVFRRGDTVWMIFDTPTKIEEPTANPAFKQAAKRFEVVSVGDSQLVRLELASDRLATVSSEGTNWVLSLGDLLLAPTVPMDLSRRFDAAGLYEMTADLQKPGRVHQFNDPVVGDVLDVVTAFPPARGIARDLTFVDFSALGTVHGLVIKPAHEKVSVKVESKLAVIRAAGGLSLSTLDSVRALDLGTDEDLRSGYIDLVSFRATDPDDFNTRQAALAGKAALADGPQRDRDRLSLSHFYIANQYGIEAIGVLQVLQKELKTRELHDDAERALAIASALAGRPRDALAILTTGQYADQIDSIMWRVIAKAELEDFKGARLDAMASESVINAYPTWVRNKFLMAAIRAAIETSDIQLANRYVAMLDFPQLDPEQTTMLKLLSGRIDEAENRLDEALATYGQVIAADYRPSRAEAVYRTMLVLQQKGELDLQKARDTLSAEALLWRGNPLEADMMKLLAELHFDAGEYRLGFETVKMAVSTYPESGPVAEVLSEAQSVFGRLYLDGNADSLEPVDALSIYYDFRHMTPPGARGDEMIRNLVRRLVKVDLLEQAADLLEYQVENRLEGAAKAQVAADLAVIEIADRKPEAALRVLFKTHSPDLPPTLQRQRRVLEARAMIDAGRDELALDMLTTLEGRDIDLLRIDAHWQAKRYGLAAGLIETLNEPADPTAPLPQPVRMSLIKAAVGFVLAEDKIGLSRLRSKFADRMAQSAEWPMFDFVTSDMKPTGTEFKQIARQVSGLDSLNAFLATYQSIYGGEGAMTPNNAREVNADI